jgi:CPA1 family monovalent cation:H+ antiporter
VLAVVVAGLVTGHESPRRLRADYRVAESVNWRTLSFLLESGIFFLMGLSLKTLTDAVARQHSGVLRAILVGLAATALVILARMVFTAPLVALLRRDERRAERTQPRLDAIQTRLDALDEQGHFSTRQKERFDRRLTQVTAKVTFLLRERLGWRGGVVLAWSGMRGAVTVAAAQTLPADTPARPVLILVAFVVAAGTLLLQGASLPAVIRLVKVPGDDPAAVRDEYRRLLVDLGRAATAVLDEPGAGYRPEVVDRVRADAHIRTDEDGERPPPTDTDAENREQYVRLRLAVLEAERQRLLDLRGSSTYSTTALTTAQRALDVDTIRLQQLGA